MIKQLFQGEHQNFKHDGYYEINPLSSGPVLIKNVRDEIILVDPGAFSHADKLVAALSDEGLNPEDIDFVLNTHHHLDHTSNNYLFKDTATIFTSSAALRPTGETTVYHDRELHEAILPEGVKSLPTPGHTMSHVSFIYEEEGKVFVCAGDAVREDLIRGENSHSCRDDDSFAKSMRKIFEIADVILPGHGRVIDGELLGELKSEILN
ncbi:MBL fold metallo-hydrolase [Patescibacteria group bacterium]|nr:MBL fold metallo-hydrolase [Patescibacteria group bacterium]